VAYYQAVGGISWLEVKVRRLRAAAADFYSVEDDGANADEQRDSDGAAVQVARGRVTSSPRSQRIFVRMTWRRSRPEYGAGADADVVHVATDDGAGQTLESGANDDGRR